MKSDPTRIPVIVHRSPVIMHTNSFLNESWDSAYDSKSDSENSDSSVDNQTPPSPKSDMVIDTSLRSFTCKWIDCGQPFDQLDELAAHVTSFHANSGPGGLFFCGWEGCGRGDRGFNARYKMLVHVRTHTNEKPHHCYQCDKSFSRAENLKIHARSHTGERPYACPIPGCGKAYSNSSDRFKHTRTHLVDKPYICKVPGCAKRYTDPSSLRKHVKTYRHFPPQTDKNTVNEDHADKKTKPDTEKETITVFKMDEEMEQEMVPEQPQRIIDCNESTNLHPSAFQRLQYPHVEISPNNYSNHYSLLEDMKFRNYVNPKELTMEEINNRVNKVQYELFRNWLDRDVHHTWEVTPCWHSNYIREDTHNEVLDLKYRHFNINSYHRTTSEHLEQDVPLDLSIQKQ